MLKNIIFITFLSFLVTVTCWAESDCKNATYSSIDGKLLIPCVEIKIPNNDNQIYEAKLKQLSSQDSIHFVVTELEEVENVSEEVESVSGKDECVKKVENISEETESVEEIDTILEKGNIPFTIITEVPENLKTVGVQQFIVIREKAHFDSFWFDSFWHKFPDSLEEKKLAIPNETPVIDFNQEMVIAVFLSFFSSDVFRIDIKHIVETNDSIIVTVRISMPDYNDPRVGLTDGFVYPHQIIKLKKSHKLVLFNTIIEVSPSWPPN